MKPLDVLDCGVQAPGLGGKSRASTILLMGATALLTGCNPLPTDSPSTALGKAPSYQQILEAQNGRVEKLNELYAQGVIEIRWQDEKGHKHFEQGDMEFWIQLPRRTALRVEKLGEVLLWLGSDDQRYWLFDLVNSKEKVLYTGSHDQPMQAQATEAFGVRPLSLLDLMGLTPLPSAGLDVPVVSRDTSLNAWVVQITKAGGPMRVFFDNDLLPIRIETLSKNGDVALFSTLRRYESGQFKGLSPLASPKIPKLIDIGGTSGNSKGEVKIAMNSVGSVDDYQALSRVFDLDRLVKALRPDRVEGQGLPPASSPATP